MTLLQGLELYVVQKNRSGVVFDSGKRYLRALVKRIGDIDLSLIQIEDVMTYLNEPEVQNSTWHLKYGVLNRFFEYWASRGESPYLAFPAPRPKTYRFFLPYIYSKNELKILFKAEDPGRETHTVVDRMTMRSLMLFLYGTGAMLNEARELKVENVDLKGRKVTIVSPAITRRRQIPICDDLCSVLARYLSWRAKHNFKNPHLFVTKSDRPLSPEAVEKMFCRIRKTANIHRESSATYQPRLLDLKFTFAVHRISSWIRSGADLNRMLPALATYMGQQFGSTERYLRLAPDRFKKQLKKLSPKGRKGHWRDNKSLMEYLGAL